MSNLTPQTPGQRWNGLCDHKSDESKHETDVLWCLSGELSCRLPHNRVWSLSAELERRLAAESPQFHSSFMLIWLFIKQAIICPLNLQIQKPGSTKVSHSSGQLLKTSTTSRRQSTSSKVMVDWQPIKIQHFSSSTPWDQMVAKNKRSHLKKVQCWIN